MGVDILPTEAKCRLFKRKDGKYLIYVAQALCEDSMFPFKEWEKDQRTEGASSIRLKISFKIGVKRLVIEPIEQGEAP